MVVACCIGEKQDAWSTSDTFFFSAFLSVTIILTKKIISWKGGSDASFV